MSPDQLNELKNSEVTRKRLAKFMAHFCFRNSKLEDFHDRISDAEMKALMIDVVNHSHLFLSVLFSSTASNEIIEILPEWKDWNEPEISDELTKNAKRVLDLIAKSRQWDAFAHLCPPPCLERASSGWWRRSSLSP